MEKEERFKGDDTVETAVEEIVMYKLLHWLLVEQTVILELPLLRPVTCRVLPFRVADATPEFELVET
jgi:hypothetical protein